MSKKKLRYFEIPKSTIYYWYGCHHACSVFTSRMGIGR